jgi:hypothetical protein
MTIALDQVSGVATDASEVTTLTCTWGTNPAAGSKVLLAVLASGDVTPEAVTDNGAVQTTFTTDGSAQGSSYGGAWIFRGDDITLPSEDDYQVTAVFGATQYITLMGASFTGVLAGAPGSGASNSDNAASESVTSLAATPVYGSSLFFGAFVTNTSDDLTITLTSSGWTQLGSEANGELYCTGAIAWLAGSGLTAQACTWTVSPSVHWGAVITAYGPAPVTFLAGPPVTARQAVKRAACY